MGTNNMSFEEARNHAEQLLEEENWERRSYGKAYTELCVSALEKQIPKKPKRDSFDNICPECQTPRNSTVVFFWQKYCPGCGQKLDWS